VSSSGSAADAAARFADAMAAAGGWEDRPLVAVALSGGPDSVCLALLARAWAAARGGAALALVLDHATRPAARLEAALAAAWAEDAGLAVRRIALPAGVARSAAGLRGARHAALAAAAAEAGALHLLFGHHAADQAETVLLRGLAGSGERGLGGIAPVRHAGPVRLLRPLLSCAPEALKAFLREARQPWVLDPSNETRGSRAPLRQAMADAAGTGVAVRALADAAERRRADAAAEAAATAALLARAASLSAAGGISLDDARLRAAPAPRQAAAVAGLLARIPGRPHAVSPRQAATLPARLAAGRAFSLGGCVLRLRGGRWRILPETRRERRAVTPSVVAVAEAARLGYADAW
jgi:tRNA(Ile)-lysidine synthase